MLASLFGNKNVARILLFLFVNERVYGAQLQTLLGIPLTPLQKALIRLEKEQILKSHYEGKIRIYQFNPVYPLRLELEGLLKKAYTLLPSQDKKNYCFIHKPKLALEEERKREKNCRKELEAFWEQLTQVQQLSFSAKTRHGEEKSTLIGKADVEVETESSSVLVFQEKGYWFHNNFPDTAFSNSFRWTLDLNASLITLEHLRYGSTHPVFLFHLAPTKPGMLESIDAHLCGEDTYLGNIVWEENVIDFHWRIIGPHKNDELIYHYSMIS